LNEWLSWKLTVKKFYYGIPKSFLVKAFFLTIRGLKYLRLIGLAEIFQSVLWVYIARKRFRDSLMAVSLARTGAMIVADRFPLQEFYHMPTPMDGPRLKDRPDWLSKIEKKYYDKINFPDRVIVLQVSFDEVRKRKSDLPIETHRIKAGAVNDIKERVGITLVNANKSYSDVLLEAKRIIWSFL
jgi:hypothetical protein